WLHAKKTVLSSLLCTKRASQARYCARRFHLNLPFNNHQNFKVRGSVVVKKASGHPKKSSSARTVS
ncbi:hypothetical protein FQN60_007467, partial [Etheostoma spectabile]